MLIFIAWIPMWAFGRKFENGKNVERLPEQRIDSLLGYIHIHLN